LARPFVRAFLCAAAILGGVVATSAASATSATGAAAQTTSAGPPVRQPFSSVVRTLPGNEVQPTAISCMAHGLCVAVDYNGRIYALSGAHSDQLAATGDSLFAVSCASKTFCMAMGNDFALELVARGSRVLRLGGDPVVGDVHWESVSCPTTTFCMAGGGIVTGLNTGAAAVARWNGSHWSVPAVTDPPRTATATNAIASVSCVGPRFCVGADDNGETFQWNGSRWSAAAPLNQPAIDDSFHVSCTSARFCLALGLGTSDVFAWNGRTWKRQAAPDLPWGNGALSCTTPDFCIGTDDTGNVSAWNGRDWSTPVTVSDISGSGIQAISCAAGTCEIVLGAGQFAYLYTGKHAPKLPMLCDEVRCPRTLT
jgi:hypothetical protein